MNFRRVTFLHFELLSDQDSNLDRQNQNLQCYHYTIGQLILKVAKLTKKPSLQRLFTSDWKRHLFLRHQCSVCRNDYILSRNLILGADRMPLILLQHIADFRRQNNHLAFGNPEFEVEAGKQPEIIPVGAKVFI